MSQNNPLSLSCPVNPSLSRVKDTISSYKVGDPVYWELNLHHITAGLFIIKIYL